MKISALRTWVLTGLMLSACTTNESRVHRGGARTTHRPGPSARTDGASIAGASQIDLREKYENVWKAVQLTFASYPVKVNDQEGGLMETDLIKGDSVWKRLGSEGRGGGGIHYSLTVVAKKIVAADGTPVVRVSVAKHIQNQADFFAPIETVATDGLEEETILYRIRRELLIDRILNHTKRG